MIFSVELALTVLLALSTFASAVPGNAPSRYAPPPPKVYGGKTKCHMSYTTLTHFTSKPYTTVVTKHKTTTYKHTKEITKSKIVYVTYTTKSLQTTYSSKTVAIPKTRIASTTKTVEKSYQCPATSYRMETHTSLSTGTSRYKTSSCVTKTREQIHTSLVSGYNTKTKESVYKTWVPYTSSTASPCTETTTSKSVYTSHKLHTKTFTSVWTEVHTVPEVYTKTVTKNYVHTTTKAVVTSTPTYITKHYTTELPYVHTKLITKIVTSTTDIPSYGIYTFTRTHVSTSRVAAVYASTCSSHSKIVKTYPVVHTAHKVRTFPVVNHEAPCTKTRKSTKFIHHPTVIHKTSVYKTRCTETPYSTYKVKTVKSHKVCPTPAIYGSGHN